MLYAVDFFQFIIFLKRNLKILYNFTDVFLLSKWLVRSAEKNKILLPKYPFV